MSTESILTFMAAVGALFTAIWTSRSMATKGELESLRKTLVALQEENKRLSMDNDKLRGRVDELENKTRSQDAASACLVDRIHELEVENKTLNAKVTALENDKARLERENQALRDRVRVLELERGGG
jgi:regulator of replication initiation timing